MQEYLETVAKQVEGRGVRFFSIPLPSLHLLYIPQETQRYMMEKREVGLVLY